MYAYFNKFGTFARISPFAKFSGWLGIPYESLINKITMVTRLERGKILAFGFLIQSFPSAQTYDGLHVTARYCCPISTKNLNVSKNFSRTHQYQIK
jgi:hypothetical protein